MKRLALALLVALAAPASAQTLRIGMKAAVDGSDPHQSYTPNRNVQMHVYESLVNQDQYLQPAAGPRGILARRRRHHLGIPPARGRAPSTTARR